MQKKKKEKKNAKVTLICRSIGNKKHNTGGENDHFEKISTI